MNIIITKACECSNADGSKFKFYDGALGFEAIVCTICARFDDHTGSHEADEWSKQFIVIDRKKSC